MSAGLTLHEFRGHDLNDAAYQTLILLTDELANSYGADIIEAEQPEGFPQRISVQPQGRDFTIKVTLMGTVGGAAGAAKMETVERWFDPREGEGYLTADDLSGGRRRLLCQPLQVTRAETTMLQISMRSSTGIWEADAETYSSTAIVATATHIAVTNAGNTKAPLRLALTPTAAKADTDGPGWMRRTSVANRSEQALDDPIGDGYPIDIGQDAFDHAALTTAKSQADGDDLLTWNNGQLIPRWLDGVDTTTMRIWLNLRRSRMVRVTVKEAMASGASPAVGATFEVSNPEGTDQLGLDEFMIVGSEVLYVRRYSRTELQVLQRGALGSTAAAHSAGDYAYRSEDPYLRLLYDWSTAAAYDDLSLVDRKPLIDFPNSTNLVHVWKRAFLTPQGTQRSAGWLPEKSDDGFTSDYIRLSEKKTAAQFTIANSEYLSAADSPALSTGDIDYMWTGWVYLDAISGEQVIVAKYTETGNQREYLINMNVGAIQFTVSNNGTATTAVVGPTLVAGQWYFVAAWHDSAANTINIQVNNGTVSSTAHTTGSFDSTSIVQFGARNGAGSPVSFLGGRMDSWGFWKRVLTAGERAWLYNGGTGRRFEELAAGALQTTMVDWWELNEESGTRVAEFGNDLADINTVTFAEGIVPGYALVFEDALAVAGKPNFNNVVRDFPVPLAASAAALEMDYTVDENALLLGVATDLDGLESNLFRRPYTTALTNQQHAPANAGQRLRLNGRIGSISGYLASGVGAMTDISLTDSATTTAYWQIVVEALSYLKGIYVAAREAAASATNIVAHLGTNTPGASWQADVLLGTITNASLTATFQYFPITLTTPIKLEPGTYYIRFFGDAGSNLRIAMSAESYSQSFRVWAGASGLRATAVGLVWTDRSNAQADAPLETGDKVTIDNVEATLDSTRAPLIVMGAEEACYYYDARIRNVRNLCTNSGFESNTTGWATSGTNTIARSTEQSHYDPARGYYGKASLKCTYGNNAEMAAFALTLPHQNQSYTAGVWVYIPAAWNAGSNIELDFSAFGSSTPGTQVNADLNKRDQWQFIRLTEAVVTDVAGSVRVITSGTAPTATEFIFVDDSQIEPGLEPNAGGNFATDGALGGEYVDFFFPSALNQRVEFDFGKKQVIDRELNLPIPACVTPSNPERWPELAPGLNSLRYEDVAASAIAVTAEVWHRGAWL